MALDDGSVAVRERLNKENLARIKKPFEVRELILFEENDILLVHTRMSKSTFMTSIDVICVFKIIKDVEDSQIF